MKELLIFSVLLSVSVLAGDKGFVEIPFSDALKKATAEKKWVMVDFYTTWCGPCKLLDRTTFKDERVTSWLMKNTIAVKIDAEKERKLARRYKVSGYPTLLFLNSDGSVTKKLMGYMNAEQFLSTAKGLGK